MHQHLENLEVSTKQQKIKLENVLLEWPPNKVLKMWLKKVLVKYLKDFLLVKQPPFLVVQ